MAIWYQNKISQKHVFQNNGVSADVAWQIKKRWTTKQFRHLNLRYVCVLVVSFPALYVFLCRLICPSNQSRYSVVWWRNIFRRNNLIIFPHTKKNWSGNLWLPRPAVSQRLNWKWELVFFTQSTKNRAKLYAHVDLPWRTFDPTQRLHKMSFWVFCSESLFSGLSTKNSTSGKILTLD